MAASPSSKPTGLIIGAVLEGLLFVGFILLVGMDHAVLFIGLCGIMFAVALVKTATAPSDPNAGDGVDPDHARIAGINRMFPQSVVVAAIAVALFSLAVGTDTVHSFARDTLGFSKTMTEPLIRL